MPLVGHNSGGAFVLYTARGAIVGGLILALPLVALGWLLAALDTGYGVLRALSGSVVALALVTLLVRLARLRLPAAIGWLLAWLLYLGAVVVAAADGLAWYFQGASFSVRFFANVRVANLAGGVRAFPLLAWVTATSLLGVGVASAWLLRRCSRMRNTTIGDWRSTSLWVALYVGALVCATVLPSPWQRLGAFAVAYRAGQPAEMAPDTARARLLADPDPVSRAVARAAPGRNLVIIYMESLERIYTDGSVFPGLTPNLDRWRARGLDYRGFRTFAGADYTIAGLFASQCGVPYLPSPVRALGLNGNNANVSSFQPSLACLGDVLHAAGYRQVFMQGAPLSFASKDRFFDLHGFDVVLGLAELEKAHGGRLPRPGWGLYDSDLFTLAVAKFNQLAAAGKPFHLDLLTVDTHPQRGRPSPGCPAYAANPNPMLQAVHCTDALVGRFLDTISRSPAWKDTVVVVMSDHESMRNDAWPLYPKTYPRRPLLFVLNAGHGQRDMRFYHMDIAPTLLRQMGVKTNVTFLAGADRSMANAGDNPLVNEPADVAMLRDAVWSRAQPLVLCRGGRLIAPADGGIRLGGQSVPMSWQGRQRVGLRSDGAWLVTTDAYHVHGDILDAVAVPRRIAARAPGESMLLIQPIGGSDPLRQFRLDWIGVGGGRAHLADVPRLRGLSLEASDCASLLARIDALGAGQTLDLDGSFRVRTASLYPQWNGALAFSGRDALPFMREAGWTRPEPWGSFAIGDYATLGFTLPREHCHGMVFRFKVHPFIAPSRPRLVVKVIANGALMTTWQFDQADAGKTFHSVSSPVRTPDARCRVDLRFEFSRPGAVAPPYPKGEDPRPLQLLFVDMQPAARSAVSDGTD